MQNNPQYDVITSGYVSMDRIIKLKTPRARGLILLAGKRTSADIRYGGCSVNISYDLCRLGIRSLPVMRVGDDYEQIGFKRFLEEGGISLAAAEVVPGQRTSVCYLLQDNEGQHITLFYPGAMDARFARPLPDGIFTGARLGVMTVGSRPDNEAFFAMCKKYGLPLVFSMKGDMDAFPAGLSGGADLLQQHYFHKRGGAAGHRTDFRRRSARHAGPGTLLPADHHARPARERLLF